MKYVPLPYHKVTGLHFGFDGGEYLWAIFNEGKKICESNPFESLELAEQNIRTVCQILYPNTIESLAVTEAIAEFKKKHK